MDSSVVNKLLFGRDLVRGRVYTRWSGKIRRRAEIRGKRLTSTMVNINSKKRARKREDARYLNSTARESSEYSDLFLSRSSVFKFLQDYTGELLFKNNSLLVIH